MTRVAWLVVAAWCGIAACTLWLDRGPPVVDPTNTDEFSGRRALALVEHLVNEAIPHPAGSEQNAIVVERIIALAQDLDYSVEIHAARHHPFRNPLQAQVPLTNILFRIAGTHPRAAQNALMLTAHHDSSIWGPGASDNASGVAILLEVARLLRHRQPKHDVIFLITDGEELGLLGADRWVVEHPWASDVRLVINVEARGTGGPSLMFQTSYPNRGLIQTFARHVRRPRSSSFFAEVYRMLPKDTDLSVYLRQGMQGYNFAFIGNCRDYHTPEDTLENLRPASLQHQGNNVWQLTRALITTDWDEVLAPRGDVVYFDLFSRWLVWWPAAWSLPIGLLAGLAWGSGSALPRHFGMSITRQHPLYLIGLGILAHLIVWLACMTAMGLVLTGLRWSPALQHPWPDRALWLIGSCWLANIIVGLTIVELARHGWNPSQWLMASGCLWTIAAMAISWYMVGASYLWLIPAALSAVALLALPPNWTHKTAAVAVILALSVGLVWLPTEPLFYDALGFKIPLIHIVRWALVGSALLPVLAHLSSSARRVALAILTAGWIVVTVLALGPFAS